MAKQRQRQSESGQQIASGPDTSLWSLAPSPVWHYNDRRYVSSAHSTFEFNCWIVSVLASSAVQHSRHRCEPSAVARGVSEITVCCNNSLLKALQPRLDNLKGCAHTETRLHAGTTKILRRQRVIPGCSVCPRSGRWRAANRRLSSHRRHTADSAIPVFSVWLSRSRWCDFAWSSLPSSGPWNPTPLFDCYCPSYRCCFKRQLETQPTLNTIWR